VANKRDFHTRVRMMGAHCRNVTNKDMVQGFVCVEKLNKE
jgi:hypothetical protein